MANKIKSETGAKRTRVLNVRITEEAADNLDELKKKLNQYEGVVFTNSDVIEILINRCHFGKLYS